MKKIGTVLSLICCVTFTTILASCGSTGTPSKLQNDISNMLALLGAGEKEAFVKEYFWGYNKILKDQGPPDQDYFQHEVESIDDSLLRWLKQAQAMEPTRREKGDIGESVTYIFSDVQGEDVHLIFTLNKYNDHWLLMNPN